MNSIPEGLEVEVEQQQSEAAIPSHHPEKFEGEEQSTTSDDLILSRLGKKPVLKVCFFLRIECEARDLIQSAVP